MVKKELRTVWHSRPPCPYCGYNIHKVVTTRQKYNDEGERYSTVRYVICKNEQCKENFSTFENLKNMFSVKKSN